METESLDWLPSIVRIGWVILLDRPHGGMRSRWIEQRVPSAFLADRVRRSCVAGKLLRGDPSGTGVERHAFRFYDASAETVARGETIWCRWHLRCWRAVNRLWWTR